MIKWFHQLFNPHCPHCKEERDELRIEKKHECNSCEILKLELERIHREKEILLEKLLKKDEPVSEPIESSPIAVSSGRKFMPAIVRQQLMAREDQKSLQLLQEREKKIQEEKFKYFKVSPEIEELEKEIGIGEGNASEISKTV